MLVLRPADAEETTLAWRLAIENTATPSALILSRQDIAPVPNVNLDGFRKGAYIVSKDENPQVVLLASGSEVSTLLAGAELLRQEGIRLQIVSVPSEGLFREQPKEYQNEVLPKGLKRFGMTAGLPCTLESLVGENGAIWGLESLRFLRTVQSAGRETRLHGTECLQTGQSPAVRPLTLKRRKTADAQREKHYLL